MTIRDLWDAGFPHAPAGFEAWGEGISDEVDSRGEVAYAEGTSTSTSGSGTPVVATHGALALSSVPLVEDRVYRVSFYVPATVYTGSPSNDGRVTHQIRRDGSTVAEARVRPRVSGTSDGAAMVSRRFIAGATGTSDFEFRSTDTDNAGMTGAGYAASAANPAYSMVEDIGPA